MMCLAALAIPGARAESVTPPSAPAAASPAPGALSQSKFLGMLYAEIARHTPSENTAGEGEVATSFHVNAQGKIDRIVIDKTTSDAHAEMVRKILGEVRAPPPPGGGLDVGQNFKFH